ncbi:MAG: DUF4038 domain-containing protein [Eubacterium sp.]|nr:DUF4038 domain-containing protein [Eubacterium sp.]
MKQYETVELTFHGPIFEGRCVDIDFNAAFSGNGQEQNVKGFYAGNGIYQVRFLPKSAGTYTYRLTGCIEEEGSLEIEPADAGRHGMVKAQGEHFCYEDGTPFYPFGTTVYALIHQPEELVDQTMDSLSKAPFNKLRFCVFPKSYDYNYNEPALYAFEKDAEGNWDVGRPCFAFWDELEKRIRELDRMGIQADLILFHPYDRWGFDSLTQKENLAYLDYAIRRLSAFPNIWWSLANEYDVSGKKLEDWEEIEAFVAEHDPWHHLLSCHNCFPIWDASRKNITHLSIQTKAFWNLAKLRETYHKPVVLDECCYEGNLPMYWGSISGHEMARRFWRAVAMGTYCTHGETFLDPGQDILWWAKGGCLKGESPARIAFLRQILESLPGPLEAIPPQIEGARNVASMPKEQQEEIFSHCEPIFRNVVTAVSRMSEQEMQDFLAAECYYQGHCKEDCYLYYYDTRTCAEDTITLPENGMYRVEVIDTWNMTRETVYERKNGRITITLPGREDMAVLAVRIED